ncbi:MAG: Gx transporter family protein [Clostridia bacterium]|nr:Gx transporter family protein [Clostridia bacterium]
MNTKKIVVLSLFVSAAMILSYIESLLPAFLPLPGVKIGLANIVTLAVMFSFGVPEALLVSLLRVALTSLLFGSPVSLFYSLLGSLLSIAVMAALSKVPCFSIIGVSIGGGVFHNLGQIIAASVVIGGTEVFVYLPLLAVSGVAAGAAVGVVCAVLLNRLLPLISLN